MEKLIKWVCILILLLTYNSYSKRDTLNYFDDAKGITSYRGSSNSSFCSRFDLIKPCRLLSVSIMLTGDIDSDGIKIRIFGHEGGMSAPLIEKDLIEPLTIFKKKKGIESIQTEISENLILDGTQFFVCIEDLNPKVYLLSDIVAKKASCTDKYDEKYYVQLIKSNSKIGSSDWSYGNFGFAVSCSVEYIPQESNLFEEIENHRLSLDTSKNKHNAAFFDYNNDNFLDVLINGKLFINQGNFKFEEKVDFLGQSISSDINLITDVSNDGMPDILLIGCDSIPNFSSNSNLLFKQQSDGSYLPEFAGNFESKNINSFAMTDYNLDGINDIIFTQDNIDIDTSRESIILKSQADKSFKVEPSIFNHSDKKDLHQTKVLVYDYNFDGQIDVVINNFNDFPSYYKNNEHSYELDETVENNNNSGEFYSYNLVTADIENDGFFDLIPAIEYKRSALKKLINAIEPGYSKYNNFDLINFYNQKLKFEDSYQGIITGDINNDSFTDLVTLPNNLCHKPSININNNGDFEPVWNTGIYNNILGIDGILIDLNNDNLSDLFIINETGISIFKNNGNLKGNSIKVKTKNNNYNQFMNSKVDLYLNETKVTYNFTSASGYLTQRPLEFVAGTGNNYIIDSAIITTNYQNHFKRIILKDINTKIQKEIVLDYNGFIDSDVSENSFSAYPNPFINNITFEFPVELNCGYNFKIMNYLGETVFEKNSDVQTGNQIKFRWETVSDEKSGNSGSYYYILKTCDKQITGKLVKVN